MIDLDNLIKEASIELSNIDNMQDFKVLHVKYLGNKSQLQQAQKNITNIPPAERKKYGQMVNAIRTQLTENFYTIQRSIEAQLIEKQIAKEKLDVTLPSIKLNNIGSKHPMTLVTEDIFNIFQQMGFEILSSPEIETEYYNFTALNTPESHPARDDQDTFYTEIADHVLLRSHVSPFQVHAMQNQSLPLRAISCGRVYRNEEVNARKLPFFHQLEIIGIDKDLTFGHLKWVLQTFFNSFFGKEVKLRFRPDFFPFTEPSAEVDAECVFCNGKGCSTCGHKGWLELLGCGMIDPNVLSESGIDTAKYKGFAAGLGIERFTMIKYGINDIRHFYSGDLRFLEQFKGL